MKIFIYFFGSRQNSVEMPQRFKRCCFPRKKTLEISDIGFFSAELQMKHHFDHMEQKTELLRNSFHLKAGFQFDAYNFTLKANQIEPKLQSANQIAMKLISFLRMSWAYRKIVVANRLVQFLHHFD